MQEHHTSAEGEKTGKLTQPGVAEQREVMRRWHRAESGMDGMRSQLPSRPDDAVAYTLLDAAGQAMNRGDWQQGIHILQLVIRDYRQSKEAACARSVIDRLREGNASRGR